MRILFTIIACLCVMITPVMAEDTAEPTPPASNIIVDDAYAFATLPGSVTGAAFMIIKNDGDIDDILVSVKSDVAKHTEIHENLIDPDDGTMMMRKIKNIAIPSKAKAVLEPKDKHIMLIKLKEPLTLNGSFPLTLVFKESGEKEIQVDIIQAGTTPEMSKEGKTDLEKSLNALKDGPPVDDDFPESSFSHDNHGM